MDTPLDELTQALRALGPRISRDEALRALGSVALTFDDVAPFVVRNQHGYARTRVARTEAFELLVMTWQPGQGSVPHDHAGSICALRIVQGQVRETLFRASSDGFVEEASSTLLGEGDVLVDASDSIHALRNDPTSTRDLVTVHVYAPPLPELRRFALRTTSRPQAFGKAAAANARRIGIVGGGYSGVMVAAHVLRTAKEPVHVTLFDRQASLGEGPAYRTVDARHLLNVPAARMSAWPDRPDDFLAWARGRDASVGPYDFLPRKTYGEYVRASLARAAEEASESAGIEVVRDEVLHARHASDASTSEGRWLVEAERSGSHRFDALVLTTGHRPPDDPLGARFAGSTTRYVRDPWSSLALSAIAPDEPVLLLGTGLTAVDVLLTVARQPRTAPVVALSRRGLVPSGHAPTFVDVVPAESWVGPLLERGPITARELLHATRLRIAAHVAEGGDWRSVIDGIRPLTATLWRALGPVEGDRFMRHVRPFWEVRRHRMAPAVAAEVQRLVDAGSFETLAARVVSAEGDEDGVWVTSRRRGESTTTRTRFAWVVNCTGPGTGPFVQSTPLLRDLVEAGHLSPDALGLGVHTDASGRALDANGAPQSDLFVVGTLRKAELWESTAVPELRAHAAIAARCALGEP